ncbi:MAG: acetyl-CoA hydrolase/transferase family protein [Methanomassiliicoccales archaeon]
MGYNVREQYQAKLTTAEEAMRQVQPGYWIDYGFFNGKPVQCDQALAARKEELSEVVVLAAVTLPPVPEVLMKDPQGDVFTYNDFHFSPLSRILQENLPNVYYNPILYSDCERYYSDINNDPSVVGTPKRQASIVQVTPMDEYGYFNFGLHNSSTFQSLTHADLVVVEVNQKLPICLGGQKERIHISQVTHVVEGDNPDLITLPMLEPGAVEDQIAQNVMPFLSDGCCLQLGIGAIPNAIGMMINKSDLEKLGGHTEMLVDAYVDLWESGKMNGLQKNIDQGKIAYTFAVGSQRLYDFMHNNPALASYNVGYINNPHIIASIDKMVSINQAVQVDLYSQINAESMGFKQVSGNGGMWDFVLGSYWSKGGRSIICLASTFVNKSGNRFSRIVPYFEPGSITTVPRQMVNIIITEYGAISLKGDSTWARAEKIISIAHPDFRDELIQAAARQKIWRRSNRLEL